MKKNLFFFLGLFFLVSCTNPPSVIQCDLEDALEGTIAFGIEEVFACSGTAAVRTSVNGWVDSAGACTKNAPTKLRLGGVSPGSICGIIAAAAISSLAGKIPSEWNCSPTGAISVVESVASIACNAVFPAMAGVSGKK